jgi:hypothetical protein
VTGRSPGWVGTPTQPGQRPVTTCVYKPEVANSFWSSWWWAVCRSKRVESSINFGILNSITRCIFLVIFYLFIFRGFMKRKVSLQCPQRFATSRYPNGDNFCLYHNGVKHSAVFCTR